jgi:hypothetical protein
MPTATKGEVTQQFLAMSRAWVAGGMTARQLIDAFTKFYRDVRVSDVDPDEGDKLLLDSSGSSSHHLIDSPADLINASDSSLKFSAEEYRYVGLSRELCPPEGAWDDDDNESKEEFGIGLSLFMFFAPPVQTDSAPSERVSSPDELDEPLQGFLKHPFVADVLNTRPTKVTCFASKIG